MLNAHATLRALNRRIALGCGIVLIATVVFVLVEITLRALGLPNLGGADEYAGYVMAGVTAWGLAFALTERAHIRIDMLVSGFRPLMRDIVDVMALVSIAVVAVTVALYGWSVLETSLASGSRANTPLETPLWVPQIIWLAGWGWFAITSCIIAAIGVGLAMSRQSGALRTLAGTEAEGEVVT